MKNLLPSISTSRCSMNSVRTKGFVSRFAPKSFTKHGWLIRLIICISWIKSLVASKKRFVFAGSMFLSDHKCAETSKHAHCSTACLCLWHTVWESNNYDYIYYSTCALVFRSVNRYERAWHSSEYSLAIPMPVHNHAGSTLDLPLLIASLHTNYLVSICNSLKQKRQASILSQPLSVRATSPWRSDSGQCGKEVSCESPRWLLQGRTVGRARWSSKRWPQTQPFQNRSRIPESSATCFHLPCCFHFWCY